MSAVTMGRLDRSQGPVRQGPLGQRTLSETTSVLRPHVEALTPHVALRSSIGKPR